MRASAVQRSSNASQHTPCCLPVRTAPKRVEVVVAIRAITRHEQRSRVRIAQRQRSCLRVISAGCRAANKALQGCVSPASLPADAQASVLHAPLLLAAGSY